MKNGYSKSRVAPHQYPRLRPVEMVGRQIRRHRELSRMSREQLALRAGTSQSQIAAIEGGSANPTLDLLDRISTALHQDMAVVFRKKLGR